MRKASYFAMPEDDALGLVDRAPTMHLASTGDLGQPVLRALHVVRVGSALYFHGAPVGEKTETLGRTAVLSYEEDVARVPSSFLDPERACPATTLYRAVQVEGTLGDVSDLDEKTEVLRALMEKLQPEGGYVPLDPKNPLYTKAIESIAVVKLTITKVTGKAKLGQNRTPEERQRLLHGFLARGHVGDLAAIEAVVSANPKDPLPEFLRATEGFRLVAHLSETQIEEAAVLLANAYWLADVPSSTVKEAFRRSSLRIGALDSKGNLVAAARATSDGRVAWIFDVMVAEQVRGRGLASGMVALMLAHPSVGKARHVRLGTRGAESFYRRFGFEDLGKTSRTVEMGRQNP